MSQSDKNAHQADGIRPICVAQPAERLIGEMHIGRLGPRRKMGASHPKRIAAPGEHQDDHDRRHVHNAQRFSARFGDAFDVLPPEIERHGDGKKRGSQISRQSNVQMGVAEEVVQKSGKVLAGGHAADRSRQNVVEHQRGNGDFRKPAAHGLLNHAIDAAADKHAATFHIQGAHRVSQEHHGENEPGRRFAKSFLSDGTCIESRGAHVIENYSSRPPKGDKAEHGRGGHEHPGNRPHGTGSFCQEGIGCHRAAGKKTVMSRVLIRRVEQRSNMARHQD